MKPDAISKQQVGAEFVQTDSKMVYGGYFCKQIAGGQYVARMYGCDALVDNQSQMPDTQYESRYEIRKALAELLSVISRDKMPSSAHEEKVILETRNQLDELLQQLNSNDVDLPDLLPEDEFQVLLEDAYTVAVDNHHELKQSDAYNVSGGIQNRDYTYLEPTARQQLQTDFNESYARLKGMADIMDNNSDYLKANIAEFATQYNQVSLQATILHMNGEEISDEKISLLERLAPVAYDAIIETGSDVMQVRTPRGMVRKYPENKTDLAQDQWDLLMHEYDEAVHRWAVSEHVTKRIVSNVGERGAAQLRLQEDVFFLEKARKIQESSGELEHFRLVSKGIEKTIRELTAALELPEREEQEEEKKDFHLDQSAIQKLKSEFTAKISDFEQIFEQIKCGSVEINSEVASDITSGYNTIILYASILDSHGYKTPTLKDQLSQYTTIVFQLVEQMGGDMMSVRTIKGVSRPYPPNNSSINGNDWNDFLQQYDEAVHDMSIAEHIAERLIPRIGHNGAYVMLIEAYNLFIKTAKTIQVSTGELNHYRLIKSVLSEQMQRLAETTGFPSDELETM